MAWLGNTVQNCFVRIDTQFQVRHILQNLSLSKFGLTTVEILGAIYFFSMCDSGTRFSTSVKRSLVEDESIDSRGNVKVTIQNFQKIMHYYTSWFSRALAKTNLVKWTPWKNVAQVFVLIPIP